VGECGKVSFAEASVAVPFVGAAAGAITISQAIRLASLQSAPLFLQIELGAPEMATLGGLTTPPETILGAFQSSFKFSPGGSCRRSTSSESKSFTTACKPFEAFPAVSRHKTGTRWRWNY